MIFIDSSIFNDIENVSHEIDYLDTGLGQSDAADEMINDFKPVMRRIALKYNGKDELKDYIRDAQNNDFVTGDDDDIKAEALDDMTNDTFDGTLNLSFIPSDSTLAHALSRYYCHVSSKNNNETFAETAARYAANGVAVSSMDDDNPEGVDGVFFTCSGTDDLFSNLDHSHIGTRLPTKKFLYFINYVNKYDPSSVKMDKEAAENDLKSYK